MFVDYYTNIYIIAKHKARTKDAMEGKNPIVFFFGVIIKVQKSLLIEIKLVLV